MENFAHGVLAMGSTIIGLFFVRFWRQTHDRLFLCFALSFWLLGFNWLCLALVGKDEPHSELYVLRLIAFALIIIGIWGKNRRSVSQGESMESAP
ncbi:MAG TPA: DUF5985 family protein [Phycisphaerae bacterium]|nr:DUF5985 family protein [Phycisphaerae bacterium]